MDIKTSNPDSIKSFLNKFYIPPQESHKGNNGKVLIIGGSSLFHSASLWAAEIASHFVDMVHYASTSENNEIFLASKKAFRNGIVVHQKDIRDYVQEDDAILIGPGMIRRDQLHEKFESKKFDEILNIEDEAEYTFYLTHHLLKNYPDKKFVLDAGALQVMDLEWLTFLQTSPILTPHQLEFERLFGVRVSEMSLEEKKVVVKEYAKKHNCVIILKAVTDIVSDGTEIVTVEGGNQGLTKGGTGDVLAGIILSLYAKNDPVTSAAMASYIEKKAAEKLFTRKGLWYNVADLIETIPTILKELIYN